MKLTENLDELIYYAWDSGISWAFATPEELGEWAAGHPQGTWDVQVR